MEAKQTVNRQFSAMTGILCLVLAMVGLLLVGGAYKPLTIAAGFAAVYLLLCRDTASLRNLPSLLLMGYVLFSGISIFWAMSGKFFLREYSKIFIAATIFLFIMLGNRFGRTEARRVYAVISGVSAIYAILSCEAATGGLTVKLLSLFPSLRSVDVGFESGTRLTGIFANANISATIFGIGILCGIALLCEAQERSDRVIGAVLLTCNAYVFLLSFSMGGTFAFAVGVIAYLVFAGAERSSALIRMLEVAVPTLVAVFIAFPFFESEDGTRLLPLLIMGVAAALVAVIENFLALRAATLLAARPKLAIAFPVAVVGLLIAYVLVGYNFTSAYTFGTDTLRRAAYPMAGTYTMETDSSAAVRVKVTSQNSSEVMMHTATTLYSGDLQGASFTVPEDSEVCYFDFAAAEGTVLEEAVLRGATAVEIPLHYPLFPGFIANRLQGLWANQNAIQRVVFFEDGMKLFALSPIVGSGVGAFETGVTSVQEFYYETRYVHNHYIQVLLEGGVIGLLLFVGALLTLMLALFRRRRQQGEFAFAYPAMWGVLLLLCIHLFVEVSFSMVIVQGFAYAVFAVAIRSCAQEGETVQDEAAVLRDRRLRAVGMLAALLPFAYSLSILGNLYASALMERKVGSMEEFLDNTELAVTLDLYESNDARASYIMAVASNGMADYVDQANVYASQLQKVHSNSIPRYLVQYYLATVQPERAAAAALSGAAYSGSKAAVWNETINRFRQSLLYGEEIADFGGRTTIDGLLAYYEALQLRNRESMETIALDSYSMDFLSKLRAVAACDADEVKNWLRERIFDLAYACDADEDGVPDQMRVLRGSAAAEEGGLSLSAGSALRFVFCPKYVADTRVFIRCAQPRSMEVQLADGTVLQGTVADDSVYFDIPADQLAAETELTLHSSAAQTVETMTVSLA